MPLLPFAEWLPDQADFSNPGSSTILNVFPRTTESYGPIGSLSPILSALAARAQGAAGFRDSSGNGSNFAGTATKLYQSTSASASWADVSGTAYTTPADEQWRFTQFNDLAIAHNISDAAQVFTLGSSSAFGNLSASAPKFRYSCVSRGFLLVQNTVDGTNGAKTQRVWWPAIGDPTNWPTLGTTGAAAVQSDAQDIVGDFGWGTGLAANIGPVDVAVFHERAVFRAMYIGSPDVWGFYPANGIRGCVAPGSIQVTEIGVIWLGPDDFYLWNGSSGAVGLGFQKIAKTFYADIDQTFLSRVTSAVDPVNKLYWVAYPSLNAGGIPDTLLVCNYGLTSLTGTPGRWAKATGQTIEILFNSVSFGYNVDTIDAATGFNTDTAPFGPDSRVWTGSAKQILSAFDNSHTMNYFTGNSLAATLQTSETEILSGRRARVNGCMPIVDGGSPTVTPITRNRIIDSTTTGSSSAVNNAGYCPLRTNARYQRFQCAIPANTSFNHAQGVFIPKEMMMDGGRQ